MRYDVSFCSRTHFNCLKFATTIAYCSMPNASCCCCCFEFFFILLCVAVPVAEWKHRTRRAAASVAGNFGKPYSLKVNVGLFGMLALFPRTDTKRADAASSGDVAWNARVGTRPVRNIFKRLESNRNWKPSRSQSRCWVARITSVWPVRTAERHLLLQSTVRYIFI